MQLNPLQHELVDTDHSDMNLLQKSLQDLYTFSEQKHSRYMVGPKRLKMQHLGDCKFVVCMVA